MKKSDRIVRVVAGKGMIIPVPRGLGVNNVKHYVTDMDAANVRWSRWVRRMLANGDLVEVEAAPPKAKASGGGTEASKRSTSKAEG